MVTGLLIIAIPLTLYIGCYFSLKSFKDGIEIGLKTQKTETPIVIQEKEIEIPKNIETDNKEFNRLMDEWLNGKPKEV